MDEKSNSPKNDLPQSLIHNLFVKNLDKTISILSYIIGLIHSLVEFDLKLSLMVIILFILLIINTIIELKRKIIPNKLTYLGIATGFVLNANLGWEFFLNSLMGFLFAGVTLIFITILLKGKFGIGNIKLGAMIGAFLGFHITAITIWLSFFLGAIVVIFLLLSKRKTVNDTIEFGPFLALGSVIAVILSVNGIDLIRLLFRWNV